MNEKKAINVLEIDNLSNYNLDSLKKQYKKISLKKHPDKPNGDKDKFIELTEAYEYIINNNFFDKNESDDNDIFKLFTKIVSLGKNTNEKSKIKEKLITIINNISSKLLDNIDRDNLIFLMQIIEKYKDIVLDNEVYEEIKRCIKEKMKNIEIYQLNPTINDLFLDNVYSLNVDNETIYVPLWHNELIYEINKKTIIVQIIPDLSDNCYIDDKSNIYFYYNMKLNSELLDKDTIDIKIDFLHFPLKVEKLKVKRNQTITFNNKGISKINNKDTYDNSIKSNLNLNITFI